MSAAALRRRRCAAQLLAGAPASDTPGGGSAATRTAVAHLLAVQAQDLRAARLALRARGAAQRAAEVDDALTQERSLVVTWLMRGTLHLVAAEDLAWLHALTAPLGAATIRRRLGQLGVSEAAAERAVATVERCLAGEGPLTRPELAERLAAAGIRAQGQTVPHLLALAAGRGSIVLGPVHGAAPAAEHAFVHTRDWLGTPAPAPDRDTSLAELARRYLRGHGPATAADLAAWSGLPLRDARAGLAAIARELAPAGDDLVDLAGRDMPRGRVPPRLLPAFDPYLLGWKDRTFAIDPAHARRVHPGGGILRASAVANGRAIATWTAPRGVVELDPFAPLAPAVAAALRREAASVAAF